MKTRFPLNSLLRTSLALSAFAIPAVFPTSLHAAPVFARVSSAARPVATSATKAQNGYIKAVPDANGNLGTAQTAIRRFTPLRGNGPSIYLVAAVHIGEKSYFQQIQQFLDKQEVVLFEGVRISRSAAMAMAMRAKSSQMAGAAAPPEGIQKKMSNALDLQFQRDGIDYDRPQFYNSDMDWDDMNALAIKAGPDVQKQLARLQNSVSGGPSVTLTDQIVDQVLTLSASTPLVATVLRRLLVTVLSDPDRAEALQQKSDPLGGAKKLDAIIVNERNKAVLADLTTLLKSSKRAPKPIRSIALFYGAGHMRDIEQHLVSDLGYRAAGGRWVTAIQAVH